MGCGRNPLDMNEVIQHLARDDKWDAYNDPREWFRTLNPPSFGLQRTKFQKQIDNIVGLSARRQSLIMLRWAWESSYMMFGKLKQRYSFVTLEIKSREVQFSVPRWVIEQRIEREQFKPSWDATRYVVDPVTVVTDTSKAKYDLNGDLTYAGDVIHAGDKLDKGECPNEWHQNLWMVADHDGQCCKKAEQMGRSCWGYYRNPSQWDLEEIKRIHHAKLNDPTYHQSPFEPLTEETLAQTAKSEFEYKERVEAEKKAELDLRMDDHFNSGLYRLRYEGPRYHFGQNVKPYTQTEAGIILPN